MVEKSDNVKDSSKLKFYALLVHEELCAGWRNKIPTRYDYHRRLSKSELVFPLPGNRIILCCVGEPNRVFQHALYHVDIFHWKFKASLFQALRIVGPAKVKIRKPTRKLTRDNNRKFPRVWFSRSFFAGPTISHPRTPSFGLLKALSLEFPFPNFLMHAYMLSIGVIFILWELGVKWQRDCGAGSVGSRNELFGLSTEW